MLPSPKSHEYDETEEVTSLDSDALKTTVLKSSITFVALTAEPGSSTFSLTNDVNEATGLSASAVTLTVTVSVAPKLSVTV